MKILILANKIPYPPKDGGSIATLQMIRGLRDEGHQVTCLAMNTSKHPFPVEKIPEEVRQGVEFSSVPCDSSIRPLKMLRNLLFSRTPYIAERFHIQEFRDRLQRLLEKETYDLVQLEGPYTAHYLNEIRHQPKIRVALRSHNVEHLIWKSKAVNERSVLKRWYLRNMTERLRKYELEVIRRCDYLVGISEEDVTRFRSLGVSLPAISVPTGISVREYEPSSLPAGPDLFFIGALDWLPNQEGLVWFLEKVFPVLVKKIEALRFHVAGRNAPGRFLKKLRHPQIIYHGEVEDARKFMSDHRVMVAPLLTGSGIRIKILEAMALGRPVVTTRTGIQGIPAIHERDVRVADDPIKFGAHLQLLIGSEESAREQADRALDFVRKKFDTFEISGRLSRFYASQA